MKTLNELKQIIKGYFESHAQINSVYYCDDFDFNAERSIQYPVAIRLKNVSTVQTTGDQLSSYLT